MTFSKIWRSALFHPFTMPPLPISRPKPLWPGISPTLSSSTLLSARSDQIKYLTNSVPIWKPNVLWNLCFPPGAPAQYWEVLPSPATGARIPVSEPGTLRTEDAAYQKLSIINFQYTPLGNWGVTSSSPFSSYLQPLAATKNRYIISQKQKNQERVLFDLLDPLQ